MRRVFDLEVLACPRCGGRLRVLALVQDPAVGRTLLTHLSRTRSAEAPGPAPPATVALASTPRSVPDPRGVPRASAPPPASLRPSLDREPAPTQDGAGSASDPEAHPARRAGPGARSGVTGATEAAAGPGRTPAAPAEVAGGGVNGSYAPSERQAAPWLDCWARSSAVAPGPARPTPGLRVSRD